MAEKIIVRQNKKYETIFLASDPHEADAAELQPVHSVYELSPYTMLLASIGSCTAILLTSYAENHKIALEEVELRLEYSRFFDEDCENCESIEKYEEQIHEEIIFTGNLSDADRKRLFAVSRQCPVHRIVEDGIQIESRMGETA
jgi:uncharacterized OsmC-like protein